MSVLSGFTVAEHILELETGKSFADFLTENVLEPAAMNNATYKDASTSTPDLARGCSRGICGYEVMSTKVKAAGGLLATARDYAKLVVPDYSHDADHSQHQCSSPCQ